MAVPRHRLVREAAKKEGVVVGLLLVLDMLRADVAHLCPQHHGADERCHRDDGGTGRVTAVSTDQRGERHIDRTAIGQVVGHTRHCHVVNLQLREQHHRPGIGLPQTPLFVRARDLVEGHHRVAADRHTGSPGPSYCLPGPLAIQHRRTAGEARVGSNHQPVQFLQVTRQEQTVDDALLGKGLVELDEHILVRVCVERSAEDKGQARILDLPVMYGDHVLALPHRHLCGRESQGVLDLLWCEFDDAPAVGAVESSGEQQFLARSPTAICQLVVEIDQRFAIPADVVLFLKLDDIGGDPCHQKVIGLHQRAGLGTLGYFLKVHVVSPSSGCPGPLRPQLRHGRKRPRRFCLPRTGSPARRRR